ncbi:MAG: peptidoglycan DD-metalloendopeptidase family protein [Deltaproteobacteria bacterium]|nr:peptidoglycan DD-metalloendopeptidase family protein [Deltaproteobacteria bacterium]
MIRLLKNLAITTFLFLPAFPFSYDVTSASISSAKQDQIDIIEFNLSREREKFEKFDSREKDLLRQVSELEQDVAERRRVIEEMREKIRIAKKEIGKLGKKQTRLEQSLKETEIKAENRLIALYKYARKGYIRILANVVDMEELWQRVVYLKAVSKEDREELSKLVEQGLRYKNEISRIKEQIEKKESAEKEAKARLVTLREDLEETVIRLMRIHKEKQFYETAVKELQLAAQDLKQTFSKIEKKRKYETTLSSQFVESKNQLPFPFEGKIIRGDKLLGLKNRNFNKGVFIEGSETEVKAIFPGRIDFSGRVKGYGEIVIINHGSRFFTISAQLSRRLMEEGDMVETGDVIGLVGNNGATKKSRLYFEIRKAGKSLDPLSWLKVK